MRLKTERSMVVLRKTCKGKKVGVEFENSSTWRKLVVICFFQIKKISFSPKSILVLIEH